MKVSLMGRGRMNGAPMIGARRANRPPLGGAFLTIWLGQTVSAIGSTTAGTGVAVWIYLRDGSLFWLGVLSAASALPALCVTPLLRLVDRFDRRHVMIGADAVAATGTAVVLAVSLVTDIEPWHLVAASLLGGAGTAIQVAAYQAALAHLVAGAAIDRANGLVQLAPAIGIVAGPAIAAPIVATWGISAVLVVDLVSFAVGLLATVLTPFAARAVPETGDNGSLRAGWAWLRSSGRPLLVLLVAASVANACLVFFNIGFVAVATEVGGAGRAGLPLAVGGAAMVVGSLIVGSCGLGRRRVRWLAIACGMFAVGCVAAASTVSLGVLTAVAAVTLVTVPFASAAVSTLFHEHVPAALQGRVFGLRSVIAQAFTPIASVAAGLVGAHLAGPLLDGSGWWPDIIGDLIGRGEGREPAALVLLAGIGLAVVTAIVARDRSVRTLDRAA